MYILHPDFAREPEHYIRAFELMQKDLHEIFDYIEPSDINLSCFSYRIHALHMRACIEIEANCKAILLENGYTAARDLKMTDYKKLDASHRLSAYQVRLPVWRGTQSLRTPFQAWAASSSLPWYKAYNVAKHDRHDQFSQANFGNLLDAVCALVALLASQFYTWDFSPAPPSHALSGIGGPPQGFESAIGGYFHIKFPRNWPTQERYDFNWQVLQNDQNPIDTLTF